LFEDIGFYKDGQLDFLYFCKWIKKTGDDWFWQQVL